MTRTVLKDGTEVAGTVDEPLDVAVFAGDPGDAAGRQLHAERLVVRGSGTLSAIVAERPDTVAIDPDFRRLDRNRGDNVRKIESRAARP